MGYGYGYCCCDDTTQCIQQPIYPWIGLHTGIKPGMAPLLMRTTIRGPTAPLFAPQPPWDGFSRTVLLFGDGFSYTRPGPQLDGFNVSVEASGDQQPFPLYPYEILRTVRSVSITRGAEVLALRWDESSDRLVRDDDLSTVTDHCIAVDWLTVFTPKIWPGNMLRANSAIGGNVLGNWKVDAAMSGWGNTPPCNLMNQNETHRPGVAGLPFYPPSPPSFIAGNSGAANIDGYVIFWTTGGPLRANNGLGGTNTRDIGVGFNRQIFNMAIGLSASGTVAWGYNPAFPGFAGSAFLDPYSSVGNCSSFGGSSANPTLGYVWKSVSTVIAGVQSAEAGFPLRGSVNRQAQSPLSPADFPDAVDCRTFVNPVNPCAVPGNLSSITETYL